MCINTQSSSYIYLWAAVSKFIVSMAWLAAAECWPRVSIMLLMMKSMKFLIRAPTIIFFFFISLRWRTYASVNHHCFREWLIAWLTQSHYLNQSWNVVIWMLWNKLQWHLNCNSCIFIHENAFRNIVCQKATILSRPQWANKSRPIRCDYLLADVLGVIRGLA